MDIDPGLEELTSDQLGPSSEPVADTPQADTMEAAPAEEPTEVPDQAPQASAVAPTPQVPETLDVFGHKLTQEQFNAILTTAQQFPHLQKKWTEAKPLLDRMEQVERERQVQQPARDPQAILGQVRATFDPKVAQAVQEGFIEGDFPQLYPNLAASLVMHRDLATASALAIQEIRQEIDQYKQQRVQDDQRNFAQNAISNLVNNMVALSTTHPAYQELGTDEGRLGYYQYLQKIDAKFEQLRDPEFLQDQFVAYRRSKFLPPAQAIADAKVQKAKVAADAKRRAVADVGSTAPRGAPAEPSFGEAFEASFGL